MIKRGTIILVVGCLAVLGACGSQDEGPEPTVTRIPNAANAPVVGSPTAAAGAASPTTAAQPTGPVEVDMVDIKFQPAEITIPANTDFTINLKNSGATVHNFNIDALNVHSGDYEPGKTGSVTVNAAPGDYEYYCAIPGHKEAGMVGTLHVVAGGAAPAESPSAAASAAPSPAATAAPSPAASPAATPSAEATPAPAGSPEIALVDINFQPKEITIAANTPVTINLVNKGAAPHNFNIDALNIHSGDIASGATASVTINAPEGVYQFYCNIPGHKEAGMVGVLKVVAGAAPPAATPSAEATPAQAGPPEVTQLDIKFEPNELTIAANTPVTINVVNKGAAVHTFDIDALNIHSGNINPGETRQITINAPEGVYQFYCAVPGHKQAGMVGTLKVAAGAAPPAGTPAATAAASPVTSPVASPVASPSTPAGALPTGDVERGKAAAMVCLGCHSVDGAKSVGPTWKGLYGSQVELESGETVTADDAYLHESIADPNAKVVKGYQPIMPNFGLDEQAIADLIAYIESLEE